MSLLDVPWDVPGAVVRDAVGLMDKAPIVSIVCEAFLLLEQLAETAKSNKDDLATLRDVCDVVINGVLENWCSGLRSGHSGLEKDFTRLQKHVDKAIEVAERCNGVGIKESVKRFVSARKTRNDIAAVRKDFLAFCSANNLVLAGDNVSVNASILALGVGVSRLHRNAIQTAPQRQRARCVRAGTTHAHNAAWLLWCSPR